MDDIDILKSEVTFHMTLVRQLAEVKVREKELKLRLEEARGGVMDDPLKAYAIALLLKGCEEQIEYLYQILKEVNT